MKRKICSLFIALMAVMAVVFAFVACDNDKDAATKYTVTYAAGEGTGTAPDGGEYAEGDTFTLPAATGLSKEGYDFDKWNDGAADYAAGATYTMPAKNVTFTAKWVVAGPKYTITVFKSNVDDQIDSVQGTLPVIGDKAEGATFAAPTEGLTLAHYHIAKWWVYVLETDQDGTEWTQKDGYDPGATITMPACNIQLKPRWVANDVTISFNANDGTGTMDSVTKAYNSTYSLPENGFTAPAGKTFQGWASTSDGTPLASGPKLCEPLVNADDTLTLYAIWEVPAPITLTIDVLVGHWTGTDHSLDVIKDNMGNEYAVGCGILDGKYLIQVFEESGAFAISSLDYDIYYALTVDGTSLVLTPTEGTAITLTAKSTLTAANRSDFIGKWKRSDTNQNWVITESAVAYGLNLSAGNSVIIGDKIALWYGAAGNNYVNVLSKSGNELVGYYDASELDPAAVTFVAGDFFLLTVEGTPNQTVNSGSAPTASKIQTPTAPAGKVFDKWVLAGTTTEFDLTAAMTADASIVATWKDAPSDDTYVGRCEHSSGSGFFAKSFTVTKIVLNADRTQLTYTLENGTSKTVNMSDNSSSQWKPTDTYGADAFYYELQIENIAVYILVKADGSKIWVCDDDDAPITGGEFTLQA